MTLNIQNEFFVKVLPTYALGEDFEAAKLDDTLAALVEVVDLAVLLLLVEDAHLSQSINNSDRVAKIIIWIAHFKNRSENVCASRHVKIEVTEHQDLILFELDILVDSIT